LYKSIEIVAAHAAQDFRVTALDLRGMCRSKAADCPVALSFQVLLAALGFQFLLIEWPQVDEAAIVEQHLQLQHMVQRFAVKYGMRTAGIVGHHAADGSPVGGGNVRGEL